MEEAGSYDTCSLLPPRRRRGPFIYGTDLPEVHPDGGTVCYHSPPLWGVERPFLRPLPSPIKDPAEAQKVNMGTIKSTWALDVLGVGLKMQRAVPERAHDVRLPLRRKIVEMWMDSALHNCCHHYSPMSRSGGEQTSKSFGAAAVAPYKSS